MGKNKLIDYLEENPDLYKILQNKKFIEVLEEIQQKPRKIKEIENKIVFKNDTILYNILDILLNSKLIKKIEIENTKSYYITDNGMKFVKLFNEKKKDLNLTGGE